MAYTTRKSHTRAVKSSSGVKIGTKVVKGGIVKKPTKKK